MNRIKLLSLLTVLFVTSCQDIYKEIFNPEGKVVPMSFYAGIETSADSVKTKTVLDGNPSDQFRSVLWEYQDEVYVTNGYSSSKFINTTQGTSTVAMLEGELSQASAYYAAYPYDMVEEYSSSSMTVTLPGKQTYFKYGIQPESFPMVAKCDEGVFDFRNLCGIFVLQLLGDKSVSSISFSGKDETGKNIPISGTGTVSMDYSDYPILEMAANASTTLELVCPDVELNTVSPTFFHIILPPGTYSSFKIVVSFTDGTSMYLKSDKALNIKRSVRTTAAVLEYNDPIDLSEDGSANCYIVSTAGKYRFDAVKGNSGESVGAVENAEVLWESFGTDVVPSIGDLVRNVNYKDGYIEFDTPSVHKEGNAVIAAKDASGTILWSWHIWLTDQPEEQVYYNNAGTMMDRNLGATSATPGDVGALGLLYQWGRKDPFLGSSNTSECVESLSTVLWPAPVSSSSHEGTIEYTVQNPMTFITKNTFTEDWYYNDSEYEEIPLWGKIYSTDNTRWQSNKTIYDPCPPGWRVPDGGSDGLWAIACDYPSLTNNYSYDNDNHGMNLRQFLGNSQNIWYPAAGARHYDDGTLVSVDLCICNWSVTPIEYYAFYLYYSYGVLRPNMCHNRASARSVRCVKEGSYIAPDYIDLSTDGTANCYIVSNPGSYKLRTVKGNSMEPVGNVASVDVLWESFGTDQSPSVGELVKRAFYSDGYIHFSTPLTLNEGNAVIAAKDASGTILWSWHIWLTDEPEEQDYYNNAGTMMDRNLGATSATPGDAGALGLLYQWGRKDPFLGSSDIALMARARSTGTWPSAVSSSSSTGTVDYVTSHPTTFVCASSSPYDWHYASKDADILWTTSGKTKSIYDPCPAGWRVPDGGSNGVWSKAGFADKTYDSTNEGMSFSISSPSTTWYPASGCRSSLNGGLDDVGSFGLYWSASPNSIYAYYLRFDGYGRVYSSNDDSRANGYSVRCVKEDSQSSDVKPVVSYATDLGAEGTSNSYIVSQSGTYKFKPVKGNSNTSVGSVSSVDVLWESFGTSETPAVGDLIKVVNYDSGYVVFATSSSFKEGNAVIAAKDASGTILWSWHIWLTDRPEEQVYYNNAGTMMDRNLGATSATPGDVGALGLLYQWGRKDPFLGSSDISSSIEAKSSAFWPSAVPSSASTGTVDYVIANPMIYVGGVSSASYWYYSSTPNNTLWHSDKTIYDPCPAGWRVPDGADNGVWANALGSQLGFTGESLYDSTNKGANFSGIFGPNATIWYPASGYRESGWGSLAASGMGGDFWSLTPDNLYAHGFSISFSGKVNPSTSSRRASAQAVRCFKIGSDLYASMTNAVDLSVDGVTANCYIVSKSGTYKFKPVKGNSSTLVGSVSSVEVLWESFGTSETTAVGDLIKAVNYDSGYVVFETPSSFKEGNAVIAAKDASGTILWSWHIWLTDQPEEHVYYNNAGTMMDRNLGATSATPGDVGALGLLYQWGRKDPFLRSSSISDKSTGTWPSSVSTSSSTGTVDYITSHPTTFVNGDSASQYDWCYASRDNALWTTSGNAKTIYDPCPAGWRVPDGGDNGVWSKTGFDDTTYGNGGISFSISSPSATWYPASGCRYGSGGDLSSVSNGFYWSASPDGFNAYYLGFNKYGSVYSSNVGSRANGFSVRCIQE